MWWSGRSRPRHAEAHYTIGITEVNGERRRTRHDAAGQAAFAKVRIGEWTHKAAPGSVSAGPGRTPLRLGRLLEHRDLALEVGDVLEALVDGREPQVRDGVDRLQALEHRETDAFARDLRPGGAHLLLDLAGQRRHRALGDRATGHRVCDAGRELDPLERLLDARPLHDDQRELLEPLVGGETTPARDALAPPADGRAFVRRTRVDHLVVGRLAVRATHGATVPPADSGTGHGARPVSGRPADDLARDERAVAARGGQCVDDRARVAAGLEPF